MKLKSFYFHFILCLIIFSVKGQQLDPTKIPDVIPPTPNAAELGRYGNMNIGLLTGSTNVTIPLLNLANGQVPVTISYNTTGIKVDQIATRVGMGWVLNAGGVITRTMISKQDEVSTRLSPDFTRHNETLYQNLFNILNPSSSKETEPDIFTYSFNGHHGKFILDANNKVIQLSARSLKIDFTNISQTSSTFTIITAEGTRYIFETVERSRSYSQIYGSSYFPTTSMVPTAWYLTKIALPNSEEILLSYSSDTLDYPVSVNEVLKKPTIASDPCTLKGCPNLPSGTFTRNSVFAYSKRIATISYKNSKIVFAYSARTDITGDKLVSSIQLIHNDIRLKQIDFVYLHSLSLYSGNYYFRIPELQKRPFLQYVIEKGSDGAEVRNHQFTYNDINGLPHRLSFSQDIYGYYNGKINTDHFVPKPESVQDQKDFPLANAERNPDFNYAVKGSLAAIRYPTGGRDSIIYEANAAMVSKDLPETYSTVNATIQGTSTTTSSSAAFMIHDSLSAVNRNVYFNGLVMITTSSEDSPSGDNFMRAEIKRNSDHTTVWARTLKYGEMVHEEKVPVLLTGTSYYLKVTALQTRVGILRYQASLKYVSKAPYTVYEPGITGGIRVQKILTSDNLGNVQTKRYYYAYLNNPSKSSGWVRKPNFKAEEEICTVAPCGPATFPSILYCHSKYMFSSSLVNLFIFGQHHVNYENVVESLGGDNYEAGGIEHSYYVTPELLAQPVIGQYFILGAKNSHGSSLHGLEKNQKFFKKSGTNFITVKQLTHTYKIDSALTNDIVAYEVKKRYDHPIDHLLLTGYDVWRYYYFSRWVYRTSTKNIEYNINGTDSMTVVQYFAFNNPKHLQLTGVSRINSQLDELQISKKYPHEMVTLNRDPNGYYQQMVNRNIISSVIEEIHLVKNNQTNKIITNYHSPFANLYLPKSVEVQRRKSDPLETRLNFISYDNKANITTVVKDDGPKTSYLWGYQQTCPIAQCTNADAVEIAYSSFEPDAYGNWGGINSASISSNYSLTGTKSYFQTGFSLSRSGMASGTAYIVSYWSRNPSGFMVTGTQTGYPKKGRAINGWTYFEHLVSGVATIIVSGSGYIDELRAYPKNAQMNTFTYDPVVGKTGECDANNVIHYYEYDNFQRLTLVRDMDRNIIRKICYDYAGSPSSCQ